MPVSYTHLDVYKRQLLLCFFSGCSGAGEEPVESGTDVYKRQRLARPESVLHELLDRTKLENVLRGENVTWFGQLMSRPQLIAWLYQVDVWFDEYNIDLAL